MEAERSYNSFGDIAIDDMSFSNCELPKPQKSCYSWQHQCTNRACVSDGRRCDLTDDCGDNSDEISSCSTYRRLVSGWRWGKQEYVASVVELEQETFVVCFGQIFQNRSVTKNITNISELRSAS